jgi:hypothetical protein
MIEDMSARKLNPHTQRSHINSCKRFAAYLKRSPDTATADEIRLFQLHLIETGVSICNRNRIMTGGAPVLADETLTLIGGHGRIKAAEHHGGRADRPARLRHGR